MKIGILTHHYINNFGAFLQGYALHKAIKELFPNDDVYIIDYINYKHFVINLCGWFRFYKNKENAKIWLEKIQLPRTFFKARKEHLKLTTRCSNAQQINRLNLDCVIVGSDEVWNYHDKKSFAPVKFGIGLNVPKLIAYAPSVGQTTGEDASTEIVEGIRKFTAVSARDQLTEKFAESVRGEAITRVTDPTFLSSIPDEIVPGITKPYIMFYYCDGLPTTEKDKIFKYAKDHGMAVYGAGESDKRYTKPTMNLTPFQWVWMFRNAAYVITGTFHGAVFSMLSHRQVACYLTNPSRIKKVGSLLKEFGLEERQSEGKAEALIKTMLQPIDYASVEEKVERRRVDSLKFLKDSIQ